MMSLTDFRTLGRSGLAVSPLALGTMTFGTARWGSNEADSRDVFRAYTEAGGNFIDTADVYADGGSEEMLGTFIHESASRDSIVLATKSGFSAGDGPHGGGNGAKHIYAALHASLRRLQTDYVDLYWVHVWDGVTPAEELLETITALIRAGKIRYWGLSNTPAWYVAKIATLAALRGLPQPIALQYFYSLVNRDVEDEHIPLATEFGMAMVPWSPLAYGFLSGKYERAAVEAAESRGDGGRLDGANPFGDMLFTDRNWKIVDVVRALAKESEQPAARIALAWVASRRGVASTLMGVSRVEQIHDNTAALDIHLTADQLTALETASAPAEPRFIYSLSSAAMRSRVVFDGQSVRGWSE